MKFYSVTVAYNPTENLENQLTKLIEAKVKPIVVYNTKPEVKLKIERQIISIINSTNVGLAKAINQGVEKCIELNGDAVFLFDQDSQPTVALIQSLIKCYIDKTSNIERIACIGPSIYNESNSENWPVPIREANRLSFSNKVQNHFQKVDFLITSGSLIPISSWLKIGGYLEDWFIDGLDIEWCYRAYSKGFETYLLSNEKLIHTIGDRKVSLFPFMKVYMILHSPIRRYYMYRNYLKMIFLDYIPNDYKIHMGRKLCKMMFAILISPIQWPSIPKIFLGIFDGFRIQKKTKK